MTPGQMASLILAQSRLSERFAGVIPSKALPLARKVHNKDCFIVFSCLKKEIRNNQPHYTGHYMVLIVNDYYCELFDPLATVRYLDKHVLHFMTHNPCLFNVRPCMTIKDINCGFICILYLTLRCHGYDCSFSLEFLFSQSALSRLKSLCNAK